MCVQPAIGSFGGLNLFMVPRKKLVKYFMTCVKVCKFILTFASLFNLNTIKQCQHNQQS